MSDTSWMSNRVCAGKTEYFFSPQTETKKARQARETVAMSLCRQCPVMLQCRDYARENSELGIWGGEDEEARWRAGYMRTAPVNMKRRLKKKYGSLVGLEIVERTGEVLQIKQ